MPNTVLVHAKSLLASKTFWLGVAEILTGVVALATELSEMLEAGEPVSLLLIAKGMLTIFLRWRTKQPVSASGETVKAVEAPRAG